MKEYEFELNQRNGWMGFWPKIGWKGVLDPENARIEAFLIEQCDTIKKGSKVLDAGAG